MAGAGPRALLTAVDGAGAANVAVASERGPAPATTAWPPHSYFR